MMLMKNFKKINLELTTTKTYAFSSKLAWFAWSVLDILWFYMNQWIITKLKNGLTNSIQ